MERLRRHLTLAICVLAVSLGIGLTWADDGRSLTSYRRASFELSGQTAPSAREILRASPVVFLEHGPYVGKRLVADESYAISSRRLPGEFEWQSALLIGCHEMLPVMPQLFGDIVEATCGQVGILALVNAC